MNGHTEVAAGGAGEPPRSRLALFEARLAGRERLPAERLAAFARLPADELRAAAHNTRQVAQRIRLDVRYARARGQSMRAALAAIDPALYSCDHGWRDIFQGLARHGADCEPMRRAAVSAYLAYLQAREESLAALAERSAATVAPATGQRARTGAPDQRAWHA